MAVAFWVGGNLAQVLLEALLDYLQCVLGDVVGLF
jgi:hypothetical protein